VNIQGRMAMTNDKDTNYCWSDLICTLRRELNLTVIEFAKEIKVRSTMTIYRWEKGDQTPEIEYQEKLKGLCRKKGFSLERFKQYTARLYLHWYPSVQFAGWVYALDKKITEKHKVKLELIHGGRSAKEDPIEKVAKGDAEFGVCGALNFLKAVIEKKYPLKAIMVVFRKTPSCLVMSEDIKDIRALSGRTVAQAELENITSLEFSLVVRGDLYAYSPTTQEVPSEFFAQLKVPGKGTFGGRTIDAIQAYVFNEPFRYTINEHVFELMMSSRKRKQSQKVRVYPLADKLSEIYTEEYRKLNGIKRESIKICPYGDVVFTSTDMLQTNKELVQNFISLSLEGWEEVRVAVDSGNESEVVEVLASHISTQWIDIEPYHYLLGLRAMFGKSVGDLSPLKAFSKNEHLESYNYVMGTAEGIGLMQFEDWQAMSLAASRYGIVLTKDPLPDFETLFTNEFVDHYYKSKSK
jgi:DNA-binding XRE family transcriptional regulator